MIKGTFYEIDLKYIGEFKFLFSENTSHKCGDKKYFMESFWNPPQYGIVDFIVGYGVDDIEEEMNRVNEDMSYFVDGARISCKVHIEEDNNDDGVYEEILRYVGL